MSNRLLTRRETEERCAISRSTVYRLMRTDSFPFPSE